MAKTNFFIIDFDSTFIKYEAMDLLAEIVLENNKDKKEIVNKIKEITKKGMEGRISFTKSLEMRLKLLDINKKNIDKLIKLLKQNITNSFLENKKFILENRKNIYIVSGGFKEYIYPVVKDFGILKENVFGNNFIYKKNKVVGFDKNNLLAKPLGKVKTVKSLKLEGDIYVVGDGYTDYEIKIKNNNAKFILFTENINREILISTADYIAKSLNDFIFNFKLQKINVLLLENIHISILEKFDKEIFSVELIKDSLSEKELIKKIKNIDILGIRSKTKVTRKVILSADNLKIIAAFCIGTDQIEIEECKKKNIQVINAPFSNSRSVVELVIAEIIILSRGIFQKSNNLHDGFWDKSANNSNEIIGKNLGIIGYGNIGTSVGILAESLGMNVYYFDIADKLSFGNAQKCNSLEELLRISDFITVHVDGRAENKLLISDKEFKQMKHNSIFLNLSRGFVVDPIALAKYIKQGKIKGAAIDVFIKEPNNGEKFKSELQNLNNVILTPHIGGSTEEAQLRIANYVGDRILSYCSLSGIIQQ